MNVYKHPDWLALEAGIVSDPANDLRRLVVADWLEEQGEVDRAEFIRLQFELDLHPHGKVARRGDYIYDLSPSFDAEWKVARKMKFREAELFNRHCDEWWPGLHSSLRYPIQSNVGRLIHAVVERGWPATLVGRADDILHGRRCGVGCWSSSDSNVCLVCGGSGRDRPYGYEIIREQPVTKIVLIDNGYFPYCLNVPSHDGDGSHREVEWFLTSDLWHLGDELSGTFETEQDALDALSDAIIADARSVLYIPNGE